MMKTHIRHLYLVNDSLVKWQKYSEVLLQCWIIWLKYLLKMQKDQPYYSLTQTIKNFEILARKTGDNTSLRSFFYAHYPVGSDKE